MSEEQRSAKHYFCDKTYLRYFHFECYNNWKAQIMTLAKSNKLGSEAKAIAESKTSDDNKNKQI